MSAVFILSNTFLQQYILSFDTKTQGCRRIVQYFCAAVSVKRYMSENSRVLWRSTVAGEQSLFHPLPLIKTTTDILMASFRQGGPTAGSAA